MASERKVRQLGEICEFRGGQGFPKRHQGAGIGKYPFIKVSDMELPGNSYRITRANHWIDEVTRKQLRAKPHPATSTIFAKIGVALTYNRRRLLSCPTIVDNNMMAAVPIETEVNPLFLYYLLKQKDFNEVVSGSALPFLNGSDLAKMEVQVTWSASWFWRWWIILSRSIPNRRRRKTLCASVAGRPPRDFSPVRRVLNH